jgi:predicted RNA-binding protein with TRAM domain
VVVGDTVQAKAHKIESSGEGQRLVEGFLHFAREPEDTPP